MADTMRDRGFQTLAVLPEEEGIREWYSGAGIETRIRWSEPLRRRRSVLGQVLYVLVGLFEAVRLAIMLRRESVDIVHVNEIRYPFALLAGRLTGATVVCHVRAAYDSRLIRTLLSGYTVLFADLVLCVSERTKDIMFDEIGLNRDHVSVLHDGVPSPERFEGEVEGNAFRKHVGAEGPIILLVSKLVRDKGQDRLIEAVDRLPDDLAVDVVLVGGTVDGHEQYAAELECLAAERPNVHITGFYPDIAEAIAAADVMVHVPRYEDPFPNVILEGMMASTPVVANRVGGIPEQVIDGETGFLVSRECDPEALAQQLADLLRDPSLRADMGKAARDRVFEAFPLEEYYDRLEEHYESGKKP